MSRRAQAPIRVILPDPKFHNDMLAKFMNVVMQSGKKSAAERIIYGALDRIAEKTNRPGAEAIGVLTAALDNVKPVVEVKSRRVGGGWSDAADAGAHFVGAPGGCSVHRLSLIHI